MIRAQRRLSAVLVGAWALGATAVHAQNTFEKTFTVSGGVTRIELNNGAGNVDVQVSNDHQVHISGKVSPGWSLFGGGEKSVEEVVANPPIEQHGDTIHIGKTSSWVKNINIDYKIEVPKDTELDATIASGGVTANQLRGPVQITSASGYIHIYSIEKDVQASAASGAIEIRNVGSYARASNASGDITITDAKGEVKASAVSGTVRIVHPGDRVEASSVSGSVKVESANNDVKAHVISGSVSVIGNPSAKRFWELKAVSGSVEIEVPPASSFLFSAESTSGDIRTSIPVVVEEQNKHSLRAHVGDASGRVEVHTVSGGISVSSS